MNEKNEKIIKRFKFFVRAWNCDSVIGDHNGLAELNDPETTGINCFAEIPEDEDPETGELIAQYSSKEEYWQHLTNIHVEKIDVNAYHEDAFEMLWYHDDKDGWLVVYENGDLRYSDEYDSPYDVDAD